jgi:hypothetical protein
VLPVLVVHDSYVAPSVPHAVLAKHEVVATSFELQYVVMDSYARVQSSQVAQVYEVPSLTRYRIELHEPALDVVHTW